MTDTITPEKREDPVWSCEDKPGKCRNPFGCHCREIADQRAALDAAIARAEKAEEQLNVVRRQRDDMNAAYQFECRAAREKDEALRPFAERATRWEKNHPVKSVHQHRDSTQITHRLGDFRTARKALGAAND